MGEEAVEAVLLSPNPYAFNVLEQAVTHVVWQFRAGDDVIQINGVINGIKFYKGNATNGGQHIGRLWSSTGTLLATANFGTETDSGWQTVNLGSPVAVVGGTDYVVSYFAPARFWRWAFFPFLAQAVVMIAQTPSGGAGLALLPGF